MAPTWCPNCEDEKETIHDPQTNSICCSDCGRIHEFDQYTNEPTFEKGANGQTRMAGMYFKGESGLGFSRERTLERAKDEIADVALALQITEGRENGIIDAALRFYQIALDRNFTKGRRKCNVTSACLYLACRANSKPFLLIDFSNHLRVNVYELGAVFLQLCRLLKLEKNPLVQKIIDPSFFIHRFTEKLLGNQKTLYHQVSTNALRILSSMKLDWMTTGRKPSGLCGAALYISSLSYGIKITKSDIASVVYVCESTLSKRLIEFEDTDSGDMTIEEFLSRTKNFMDSGQPRLRKPGEIREILCRHEDGTHFAHGLCEECYKEFIEVSGGLQGGADPPAFQRAERQRMKEKEQENGGWSDNEIDPVSSSKVISDSTKTEEMGSAEREKTGNQAENATMPNQPTNREESTNDDRETLSDIDDEEVAGYLHNEDEKQLKEIIWTEMNKEYLEEQAAKEAAAAEAPPKVKKERKRRRAEDDTPADTPLKATQKMLEKKKVSSRINYAALDALYKSDEVSTEKQQSKADNDNERQESGDQGFGDVDDFGAYEYRDEHSYED